MQNLMLLRWGIDMQARGALCPEKPNPVLLAAPFAMTAPTSTVQLVSAGMVQPVDAETKQAGPAFLQGSVLGATTSSTTSVSTRAPIPAFSVAVVTTAWPAGPQAGAAGSPAVRRQRLVPQSSLFSVPRDELRLFGHVVPPSVRICVGFSTVSRKKDYVLTTVGEMLGLSANGVITAAERAMVVTVAHLADVNLDWVDRMSTRLQADYADLVATGYFHGIHAPEELYPNLTICPPFCSYKDEPKRVRWRSKQNIDYAFLMYYAAPLAPYYLQIEDDIIFSQNWVSKISDFLTAEYPVGFLSKQNAPWRMIDFSQLGFIGKMFQSNELTRMAQFLLLFYDQMPCDLLVGDWMNTMTQIKRIDYWKKHPSLFQHIGIFRSLGGYQPLQEKRFGKSLFDNPSGSILTNMTIVPSYDEKFAYFPHGEPATRKDVCDYAASPKTAQAKKKWCWFWAKRLLPGDHLTIVFDIDISMKAVFVEFGIPAHPKDLLANGSIQVAASSSRTAVVGSPNRYGFAASDIQGLEVCGMFHHLVQVSRDPMIYWEEGASLPPKLPVYRVRCLRIASLSKQEDWTIVNQIQVRSL